jgi:uncharacterized SAM-binding protein YcdF (DUF218 family)
MSEVIIVAGAGITPEGTLPPIAKKRVEKAIAVRGNNPTPLIFAGKWSLLLDVQPPKTEADAMRDYARHIADIPDEQLLTETHSMDTAGNAYFCKTQIIEPRRWLGITVVTSEFHLDRTEYLCNKIFGPHYSLEYVAANSGLSEQDMRQKAPLERTLLDFYKRLFAKVDDGDNHAIWQALQNLPGYSVTPQFSRQELIQLVQSKAPTVDTYGLTEE